MKNRNGWIWIAFGCCACLVAGAMLWLTRSVIHTEHDRANAEMRAELQERIRLSLWRMDSLGTSMLLEENAIPTDGFVESQPVSLPILARFETPDGAAMRGSGDARVLTTIGKLLPGLMSDFRTTQLERKKQQSADLQEEQASITEDADNEQATYSKARRNLKSQAYANKIEWQSRERILDQALANQNQYQQKELAPKGEPSASTSRAAIPAVMGKVITNPVGEFKPTWFEGSLFLVRRGMTLTSFAQGTQVQVPNLSQLLLTEAKPLLPHAALIPAGHGGDDSYNLASFPFQLQAGSLDTIYESIPRTISISLLAGWVAASVALLTAYFLIANVMKLSERRASFVSAVTHELRTPLTTFRLYSDMLSSGAVREEKRLSYLQVLSREADRLSHLVENVLAFSKIERGSARSQIADVELNTLLESFGDRLSSRLEAAGLKLEQQPTEPIHLQLDASALEHILFNLIDNAAKYAAASDPPLVSLSAHARNGTIEISVSDHGPGITADDRRRIFRAFHKSAKQAAESQPGVGLGLSLSRRLARSMGGSLDCRPRRDGQDGAEFVLSLPRNQMPKC